MQTLHIESSCEYPSIRDFLAIGFERASCQYHSLDSQSVRDFPVDLVFALVGALGVELPLFLLFAFSMVDVTSSVAGTMIYAID